MKRQAGIVLAGALVALAVVQSAASAAPAGLSSFSLQTASVVTPQTSGCSFDIVVTGLDQVSVQTTYDRSGNPIKLVQRIDYTGTQTAKSVSLDVSEHAVVTVDLVAGTETVTGEQLKVSPAKGAPVLLGVGRIVTDQNGNRVEHGWQPTSQDTARYCAAFGN
ncbi:MAG: hypothetical protein M3290_06315 [Actinomycetota bacterium]|nr:hypothetical protein [Actinomycetota bacterium]